jgi:hypothetical protein
MEPSTVPHNALATVNPSELRKVVDLSQGMGCPRDDNSVEAKQQPAESRHYSAL